MSKIILKTLKRRTKVSDRAITKAVEKAYSHTEDKPAGRNSKRVAGSAPSQSRKKK